MNFNIRRRLFVRSIALILVCSVLSWCSAVLISYHLLPSNNQPNPVRTSSSDTRSTWPGPVPGAWIQQPIEREKQTAWSVSIGNWTHTVAEGNALESSRREYRRQIYGFPIPCFAIDDVDEYFIGNGPVWSKQHNTWPYSGTSYTDPFASKREQPDPFLGAFGFQQPKPVLPLVPWWPGFILNTAILAIAFANIARILRFARWGERLSRGQCPKCKYPIGAKPVCSECGLAVPGGLVQANAAKADAVSGDPSS